MEYTIAGRETEIKEYLIGTEVYQRGTDFDPKLDSIVRVEAYRLRSRLEEYYRENPAPAVRIELPKGSYVPVFHRREAIPAGEPRRSNRRRWMGAAIAGAVAVAGGGMVIARRRRPAGRVTIHLVAGDTLTGAALRVKLAHRLGSLLPEGALNSKGEFQELRSLAGEAAADTYAAALCGERSRPTAAGVLVAEAGGISSDVTTCAVLESYSPAEADAVAAKAAEQLADAVERAEVEERRLSGESRALYRETVTLFRKGQDSLLLRAREAEEGWPLAEILAGIDKLGQVVRREPAFAAAHAQQAWLCSLAATYDRRMFAKAEEAARRALALDPRVWKAHFNLGYVQFFEKWRFREAADHFASSVKLAPLRFEITRYYSDGLALVGRGQEAAETMEILAAAAPNHRLIRSATAALAYHRGDFPRMRELAEGTLAGAPDDPVGLWQKGLALEQLGEAEEAERTWCGLLSAQPRDRRAAGALAHLLARTGRKAEAWERVKQHQIGQNHYLRALVHAGSGETAAAVQELDASWSARESGLPYFRLDPRFAAIREAPGGRAILERLGLA